MSEEVSLGDGHLGEKDQGQEHGEEETGLHDLDLQLNKYYTRNQPSI